MVDIFLFIRIPDRELRGPFTPNREFRGRHFSFIATFFFYCLLLLSCCTSQSAVFDLADWIFELGRIAWIFSSHILDIPNFQSQLMMLILDTPTTICTAQLRWNIVQQNESNRKRTADRARADRAGGATQRLLRRQQQLDWAACNGCNGLTEHIIDHVIDQGRM